MSRVRRWRSRLLAAVLAASFGSVAYSQDLPDTISAEGKERLIRLLTQARAGRLPVVYLENKIREGAAKQVLSERLVEEVERRGAQLAEHARALEMELREHGKADLSAEERSDVLLSMQHAHDLRLSPAARTAVVRISIQVQEKAQVDPKLMREAIHLAGVCRGAGMLDDQAGELSRRGVAKKYGPEGLAKVASWILRQREATGDRFPADKVHGWLKEGIEKYAVDEAITSWDHQMHREHPTSTHPASSRHSEPHH